MIRKIKTGWHNSSSETHSLPSPIKICFNEMLATQERRVFGFEVLPLHCHLPQSSPLRVFRKPEKDVEIKALYGTDSYTALTC